jgi:hypothetical protein
MLPLNREMACELVKTILAESQAYQLNNLFPGDPTIRLVTLAMALG